MTQDTVGFIGLGNLGKAIADNIAKGGFEMCVYDVVGADERAPQGAVVGASVSEVAERSGLIFICLPTVESIETVVDEICSANIADGTVVVNNSTAGPTCAIAAHGRLGKKGIAYADATISATPPRARAAEAIVMFSGEPDVRKRLTPVFESFSKQVFDLGTVVGNGQRMKLINNCLVHTALVVSSEAMVWGEKGGLELKTMLKVLAETSGRNVVTDHFFPDDVLTEKYASGGSIDIIRKDIELFVGEAKAAGCLHAVAETAYNVIKDCQEQVPGLDQTMMYPYTKSGGKVSA